MNTVRVSFVLVFLTSQLPGQSLVLEKEIFLDLERSGPHVFISANEIVIARGRELRLYDGAKGAETGIHEVRRGLEIYHLDYYAGKIVYVYGIAWSTMIAVFDLATGESHDWRDIEKASRDRNEPVIFKDAYWIDKESILYQVWNSELQTDELRSYNLNNRASQLLLSKALTTVIDYSREERAVVYVAGDSKARDTIRVLHIDDGTDYPLITRHLHSVLMISRDAFLAGISDPEHMGGNSLFLIEDGKLKRLDGASNLVLGRYYRDLGLVSAYVKDSVEPILSYHLGLFGLVHEEK